MKSAGEIILTHIRATIDLILLVKKVEKRFNARGLYLIPEMILKDLDKSLTWLQLHSHHFMNEEETQAVIRLLNDLRNECLEDPALRVRLEEILADVEKRGKLR